jgi:hypothetical protein
MTDTPQIDKTTIFLLDQLLHCDHNLQHYNFTVQWGILLIPSKYQNTFSKKCISHGSKTKLNPSHIFLTRKGWAKKIVLASWVIPALTTTMFMMDWVLCILLKKTMQLSESPQTSRMNNLCSNLDTYFFIRFWKYKTCTSAFFLL